MHWMLSILFAINSAANATTSPYHGTWILDNRICSDDSTPMDSFADQVDNLELTISEKFVHFDLNIEGIPTRIIGNFSLARHEISTPGNEIENLSPGLFTVSFTDEDHLVLSTTRFPVEGGSCPINFYLKFLFTRVVS